MGPASVAPTDQRLGRLLGLDVTTTTVAVIVLLAVHLFVVASDYVLLLAAMVAGAGTIMVAAFVPLRRGRVRAAVAMLAVANYLIALGATAIAPFAMPILLMATMLPPVLAVPYVTRRQLRLSVMASCMVALGVSTLGSLQDVTGFSETLPRWLPPAVVVLFTPFMAAMVSIIALTNATALADSVAELRTSRARVVAAADRERRRIERDLHDGAQPVLLGATVRLADARRVAERRDPTVAAALDTVRDDLHHAIAQLRDLAHGVYPAALTEAGLAAALRHAVARFPGDATMDLRTAKRFDPDIESAAYFCCAEALNNALKHGGETARVQVMLDADDAEMRFAIWDDGRGFDPAALTAGAGFENMADRLGAVGGQLRITSSIGEGTRVAGIVPVRRIGARTRDGERDGRHMWTASQVLPESIAAV